MNIRLTLMGVLGAWAFTTIVFMVIDNPFKAGAVAVAVSLGWIILQGMNSNDSNPQTSERLL